MPGNTRMIGLLRFSVLTPTFYAPEFGSLDAAAAHIFSDARMELRFHIFENLCLPSLTRQTDQNFDMVVLTAASMPSPWLERLENLLDPLPNFHLVKADPGPHYRLIQNAYASVPADGCSHLLQFRLDDDDAVDRDFVARTKRLADGLIKVQGPKTPFIIAYSSGFYVRRTPEGNDVFDSTERAPLSTGTTLVAPVGHAANPYRFVHRKLLQHYNTFSDISLPAFIRTIHGDNKSGTPQMGITRQLEELQTMRRLRRHFGVDLEWLRAL